MKGQGKRIFVLGCVLIACFGVWTFLIQTVDVQPIGVKGTSVGFAVVNGWFHELTGVNMELYNITDWLGLVPVLICMIFGWIGLVQWIRRKSIFKVDYDVIILGVYYVTVIAAYLLFEMIPINYRPVLIGGFMESSYPSSTTLLVLCVMPTLSEQINRRAKNKTYRRVVKILVIVFSIFMVAGRLISGVHWLTDIVGAIMLSVGLFCIYRASVLLCYKEKS